jgi:hypothetical protein
MEDKSDIESVCLSAETKVEEIPTIEYSDTTAFEERQATLIRALAVGQELSICVENEPETESVCLSADPHISEPTSILDDSSDEGDTSESITVEPFPIEEKSTINMHEPDIQSVILKTSAIPSETVHTVSHEEEYEIGNSAVIEASVLENAPEIEIAASEVETVIMSASEFVPEQPYNLDISFADSKDEIADFQVESVSVMESQTIEVFEADDVDELFEYVDHKDDSVDSAYEAKLMNQSNDDTIDEKDIAGFPKIDDRAEEEFDLIEEPKVEYPVESVPQLPELKMFEYVQPIEALPSLNQLEALPREESPDISYIQTKDEEDTLSIHSEEETTPFHVAFLKQTSITEESPHKIESLVIVKLLMSVLSWRINQT